MAKKNKKREPEFLPSPLNNPMINYREYYMSVGEKLSAFLTTFLLGGLTGLVFYGGLFKADGEATLATLISNAVVFCLIGGIAAKIFVPVIQRARQNKRDKQLRKQFMDMLESLSTSLSAGNTVSDSFVNAHLDLQNQYSGRDFIIRELSEIVSGLRNGKTLEDMVLSFGERSNNEDIKNFGNVISNCFRMGGNFRDVVRRTRDIISDKTAIEDEIRTKVASNKLQHNAMCVMPIVLMGMLKITSSDFAQNLAKGKGVIITTVAVVIFIASYFWGQKIIDIK